MMQMASRESQKPIEIRDKRFTFNLSASEYDQMKRVSNRLHSPASYVIRSLLANLEQRLLGLGEVAEHAEACPIAVPSGSQLRSLKVAADISVSQLSRMTRISRNTIYRVFEDEETKDSTRIMIYLALTKPELFIFKEAK